MNSRTEKTFKNASMSMICQIIILIFNFATRTLFIKFLGADYLGINGLFTNVLTMLSLSELGFGTAIVFNLYKTIASNDKEKTTAYLNYYGHIYRIIFWVVLGLGLALLPFLKYIIKFDTSNGIAMNEIKIYYVMFLFQSALSYLFVYKTCIIDADQRKYIVTGWTTAFTIVRSLLQIVFFIFTHKYFPFISYFIYLLINILFTLFNNIFITKIAEKEYPYIKNKKPKITETEKKDLISNVKAIFLIRIGSLLYNQTSNIIISVIISTTMVGYYSNYIMLTNILIALINLLFGGINASIGSFINTNNKKESCECFYMINFAQFWIFSLITVILFLSMEDFIKLWVGKEYNLGMLFLAVLLFNIFTEGILNSVWAFENASGIFKQIKYLSIITAIVSVFFNIILGKIYGICGIISGTIISRFLISWWHPYILFKQFFKQSLKLYYLRTFYYISLEIVFFFIIYYLKPYIKISNWFDLILEIIVSFIIINILFYTIFCRSVYFKMIYQRINSLIINKYKRNNK